MKFTNLTPINGFDSTNLNNARQNNYAWSMSELDNFIYVGTGRNILYNIIKQLEPGTKIPDLIKPDPVDNRAEIWRYDKDGLIDWQRVYKAPADSGITGFRFMINHIPFGGSPALYAASYGNSVKVLKSTNGVNWFILPGNLAGTSSRAMVNFRGKLYMSTVDESSSSEIPYLYSSPDPEFFPWRLITDVNDPDFDPEQNPKGAISNMAVFNNRLYVATSSSEGAAVWRTNGHEPRMNDWTLVVDNGFGDPANVYTLSIGVFKDHLYVGGTKQLPLAWFIPMGCDIVRIDKRDNWELVVGGNPFIPVGSLDQCCHCHHDDYRRRIGSGFNNPFNVYAWQIQEYKGKLLISTFDDSSNMEVILTTLLANREALYEIIGVLITDILIEIYLSVVEILRAIHYPIGFDLYVSGDGVNFKPVTLNGLNNPNNYGGRMLFVDKYYGLYLGTANPFQGCEVYKIREFDNCHESYLGDEHYANLWKARDILLEKYSLIEEHMPTILKFMPDNGYKNFIV